MALAPRTHLETPYVFVDTQAYIANQCDWSGTHLNKLLDLALEGSIKLLYTTITRREVLRQIDEKVNEALQRATKFKAMVRNAGLDLAPLSDGLMAQRSAAAFDSYLSKGAALEVPITVDLDQLLDDYFEHRPPFSKVKRKEFPDAIVCASLLNWARKKGTPIYIISGDPDFEAYTTANPSLILLKSVPDLLSRAVVSAEILHALVQQLRDATFVQTKLAEALQGRRVSTGPFVWPITAHGTVVTATVIGIGAINVVDRTFNALKCEFEFDAELSAIVAIEDMSKQAGWISTSPPHRERLRINRSFTATIEADRAIEKAGFSFQHIQIEREEIILSKSEVPGTEQLSGGVFD